MIETTTATKKDKNIMKTVNRWKTSDIRIHKDSVGAFEATHKYAGTLIDWDFFESRAECRRAAVEILKEKKSEDLS